MDDMMLKGNGQWKKRRKIAPQYDLRVSAFKRHAFALLVIGKYSGGPWETVLRKIYE
jgi:hypothetical protein